MSPDRVFELASTAALVGWLLLIAGVLAPAGAARRTLLLWGGRVLPLALCLAYLALLIVHWRSAPGGGFGSLQGVITLFAAPGKLLGGWVHFLAFDLFVARWMVDDTLHTGRSRWCLLPSLPLTFLFGPAGLLLHFACRAVPLRTLPA